MKILTICPAHLKAYKIGGPIASIESMNKGLLYADQIIEIDVLSTSYGLDDDSNVKFNVWETVDNISNYNVKYFKYYGNGSLTFSPKLFIEAKQSIHNYDLVILHGVWNFPFFAVAYLARKANIPYVVFPHGTLYKETWELKSKFYKDILYSFTIKKMLENASRIQFTTIDEQINVLDYLGLDLKYFIIPNSIDLSKYSTMPKKGYFINKYPSLKSKNILLFFGRVTRKKGLDILIDALNILKTKRDDFILLIAGPDNEGYYSSIKKQIEEYGLSEYVLYVGMLEGKDKDSVLVDSDVFVLTSYSENFGMSVVESMLAGLPVIISDKVGIYKEVEKEDAGIVTSLNPNEIANSINMLLSDKNKRVYYSQRGIEFVEKYYDINKVNHLLLTELRKIVNESK